MGTKEKLLKLEKEFAENAAAYTALSHQIINFKYEMFDELYLGKFFKNTNSPHRTQYYLCKKRKEREQHNLGHNPPVEGVFDFFTILENVEHPLGRLEYRNLVFGQDSIIAVHVGCKEEISREEYEEAFEKFQKHLYDFTKIKREVLIEKKA